MTEDLSASSSLCKWFHVSGLQKDSKAPTPLWRVLQQKNSPAVYASTRTDCHSQGGHHQRVIGFGAGLELLKRGSVFVLLPHFIWTPDKNVEHYSSVCCQCWKTSKELWSSTCPLPVHAQFWVKTSAIVKLIKSSGNFTCCTQNDVCYWSWKAVVS